MLLLALDSSTAVAGVAVASPERVVGEISTNVSAVHSRRLLPLVDALLRELGLTLREVDGLAVATGPGSFTGLRIGLATAKGLAFAAGKPLLGVPTLDALAANLPGWPGVICPVLQARREEVYAACYRWEAGRPRRLGDYRVTSPAALARELAGREGVALLGDGAPAVAQAWEGSVPPPFLPPPAFQQPRAATVAGLALPRLAAGEEDDLGALRPLYVLPPAAEARLSTRLAGETGGL